MPRTSSSARRRMLNSCRPKPSVSCAYGGSVSRSTSTSASADRKAHSDADTALGSSVPGGSSTAPPPASCMS